MSAGRHDTEAMGVAGHPWDELRLVPTGWTVGGEGFHESLLRSYRLVVVLRDMIQRGDSRETLLAFIAWVGCQADGGHYRCQDADIRLARQFELITELEASIQKGEVLEQAARKHELRLVCNWLSTEPVPRDHGRVRFFDLIDQLHDGAHLQPIVSVPQADGHHIEPCLFAGCERTDEHKHIVQPPEIPF